MQKFLLILIALFLLSSLMAVPTLKMIRTHDYSYANRIVIVFSGPVKYQIADDSANNSLKIRVSDVAKDESYVEPKLEGNQTVRSILVEMKKPDLYVNITTGMPYRREIMTLREEGFKIVLDIFQKEPPATFEAGLAIANFYFSTHQFNMAAPLFKKLEANYPDRQEINYYIGKNLLGQKRYDEAIARFEKVPTTARESEFSVLLINKLKGYNKYSELPSDFLDSNYDSALSSPPVAKEKPAETPNVTFQTVTPPKSNRTSLLTQVMSTKIPLWIAAICLVLIVIIFSLSRPRRPRSAMQFERPVKERTQKFQREINKEPTIFVDEDSKRKMISKLLHDGWSNKEIAKELHISESEVEHAVKQLSVSDFS